MWKIAHEGVICCMRSAGVISHSATQPAEFYESINLSSFINLCPIQRPPWPPLSWAGRLTRRHIRLWQRERPDWLAILPCRVCAGLTGEMGQSKQGLKAAFAHHRVPCWLLKWTRQRYKRWLLWSEVMLRLEWGLQRWWSADLGDKSSSYATLKS